MAAQIVPTLYIQASNSVTYAYRKIGPTNRTSVPLLMHIHFRANMDFWDPLLLNSLARSRTVIIFDQSGIGRSTGTVPSSYQGWADSLLSFADALDLKQFDLLGFSMGGRCVQMVALTRPDRVRTLILAGTDCSAPHDGRERVAPPSEPLKQLASAGPTEIAARDAIRVSFFLQDASGKEAADGYWSRVHEREARGEERNLILLDRNGGSKEQIAASIAWGKTTRPGLSWHRLHELKMPVLVLLGEDDALIPTPWGRHLAERIPGAKVKVYPQTGHGFIWQNAEEVANDVNSFIAHAVNQSKL
ncbi:Alpha/Beta hydrolase protein [Favolaschia claudopus]|uniref:Alpha/Beta hydrolase protein n=1 Tax=Favolaschia claudopus TaxID=2862362 RepID=A0AAW0EDV7_9AGAR